MENNFWAHPNHETGITSHRFHRENLVDVKGKIVKKFPKQVEAWVVRRVTDRLSLPQSKTDLKALHLLGSTNVPAEDYLSRNSLFIDNKQVSNNLAISNPDAGRSVTKNEGVVYQNQIFPEHNIKGVGKTKSVSRSHALKNIQQLSGMSQDYATDMMGTEIANLAGVSTPIFLPTIELQEVVVDGKRIKSNKIFNDPVYLIHRLWPSDRRVTSLYISTSSYFSSEDMDHVLERPTLFKKVYDKRISRLLERSKNVERFNKENKTTYKFGLNYLMSGNFSIQSYAQAFRSQSAINIARSIRGGIFHANSSAQNISELSNQGDWDLFFRLTPNGLTVYGYEELYTYNEQKKIDEEITRLVHDNTHQFWLCQSYISAMSGVDLISEGDFWNKVREQLSPEDLMINKSWKEIESTVFPERQRSLFSVMDHWESLFKEIKNKTNPL